MCLASRNNYQDYKRPHFLVFTTLLLYILTTVGVYCAWVEAILIFITAGKSFWTEYNVTPKVSTLLAEEIAAILSTVLADATLAWDLICVFVRVRLYIPRYGAAGLSGVGHGVWCSFRLLAPPWE